MSKALQAYEGIKGLVASNRLHPGQKLIYRELERELGMSKTPIINGLMMLEQEGLVLSERNRGFFMRPVSAVEAEQIYDLREKIEDISIEYAIRNQQPGDLIELEERVRRYRAYYSPFYDRRRLDLDTAIHMQIAQMGRNEFFIAMIERFYQNIYFRLNVAALGALVDKFAEDHERLLDAIRRKSLAEAKRILRSHTRAARKVMLAALGS
ncbi:MAG: GntR family transcriptional regulator [Rhodospirillales bacterium]|nr:GntR family transcriptional regulator [Rhodospirillales bacterium]